jgi:hypothetical protein
VLQHARTAVEHLQRDVMTIIYFLGNRNRLMFEREQSTK